MISLAATSAASHAFVLGRPILDPQASLQDVLGALLGRLDSVQRRAFQDKMMQLDGQHPPRSSSGGSPRRRAEALAQTSPLLC